MFVWHLNLLFVWSFNVIHVVFFLFTSVVYLWPSHKIMQTFGTTNKSCSIALIGKYRCYPQQLFFMIGSLGWTLPFCKAWCQVNILVHGSGGLCDIIWGFSMLPVLNCEEMFIIQCHKVMGYQHQSMNIFSLSSDSAYLPEKRRQRTGSGLSWERFH